MPGLVSAQQSTSGTTDLDRIAVTGSRIRRVDVETAQPVLTLSREDIQAQGFSSVADILQNVSAAGSPPFSRSSPLTSNQEAGGQYVDLRNLGAQRTLVLVNGKRLGISPAGFQDLSTIPTVMVERIEVLKDGASSIYGSDAIAGVINIITRKDFDGAEFNLYGGEYGQGDGRKETADFMVGFSGERGSITIGAEYHKEEVVWARDRWFSSDSYPGFPEYSFTRVGQWGNWRVGDSGPWQVADRGSSALPGGAWHNQTDDDTSKSIDQMQLLIPLERRSLYVNANYDVTENIRFVTDIGYTRRESSSQVAGYPLESYQLDINTPMSADSYFNPTGGASAVNFRRRGWENPRTTQTEQTNWRITAALEGMFQLGERYFNWDIGGLFNETDTSIIGNGNYYLPGVRAAVGPSFMNAEGRIVCGTPGNEIAGCVPWNPFAGSGTGAVEHSLDDPRVRNFIYRQTHSTGNTTTHNYFANLTGNLLQLPAGDLSFAAGYEYRREQGRYVPDGTTQAGETTDLTQFATGGQYKVDEFYLELNVPILADLPGAQELSVDLASRYSDFDTFGDTTNNKFGLKWRPLDDLLIRGTWAEGFRAPTIDDLYGGGSQSFTRGVMDPCDSVYGVAGGSVRCLQDVPAGYRQLKQGFVPTTSAADQTPVPFNSGSNPDLVPETSRSKTLGFVYSPSAINGFSIGVDWWNIHIKNSISGDHPNTIMRDCYVRLIESRCTLFKRDPALGSIVSELTYAMRNVGYVDVEGVDISLSYQLNTRIGLWSLRSETSYTSKHEIKVTDDADAVPSQNNGFNDYFRTRSNLNLGWKLKDVAVNWGLRYFSGTKESCYFDEVCNLPDYSSPSTNGVTDPMNKTGSVTFQDLQVAYSAPWNARISIGANNVFDKRLPLMYDAASSDYSFYSGFDLGRFVYVRYNQKF